MSQEFAGAELKLGQANALVKILGGMAVVMQILQGTAKALVTVVKHVIDMDANPYIPNNWKVESHKKAGSLEWDPEKIQLYFSAEQQGGKWIKGDKLQKELETQPVLNANLLDYFLAHPELIPESWKGNTIFFWGTIYRDSDGYLCVRSLYWYGRSWGWYYCWLDSDFYSYYPAAVAGK